jgi:hypothetical protein
MFANLKELDFTSQQRVSWNSAWYPHLSIGEVRANNNFSRPAYAHARNPIAQPGNACAPPQLDHHFRSEEWRAAYFISSPQKLPQIHGDNALLRSLVSGSDDQIPNFDSLGHE